MLFKEIVDDGQKAITIAHPEHFVQLQIRHNVGILVACLGLQCLPSSEFLIRVVQIKTNSTYHIFLLLYLKCITLYLGIIPLFIRRLLHTSCINCLFSISVPVNLSPTYSKRNSPFLMILVVNIPKPAMQTKQLYLKVIYGGFYFFLLLNIIEVQPIITSFKSYKLRKIIFSNII